MNRAVKGRLEYRRKLANRRKGTRNLCCTARSITRFIAGGTLQIVEVPRVFRVPERQALAETLGHDRQLVVCAGQGPRGIELVFRHVLGLKVPLPELDGIQDRIRHDQLPSSPCFGGVEVAILNQPTRPK